jgi:hypothetical protein
MIAMVEICDLCGTRFQGPALAPNKTNLHAAMMILEKHLPEPGTRLQWACPKCSGQPLTDEEKLCFDRAAARGRGEDLGELDKNNFDELVFRGRAS